MTDLTQNLPPLFGRLIDRMVRAKEWLLAIGCLIMAGTFFLVVIFRYGFNEDLFAYEEWLLIICFWMYFIGAAIGTHDKTHVNADLLSYVIKDPKWAWVRTGLVGTIELVVALALTYWSILMLVDEIASYPRWRTTIALGIPFFVPRLAMLFGFGFMSFYSLLHLIVLIKNGPRAQKSIKEQDT